jgi:hypothetical protein
MTDWRSAMRDAAERDEQDHLLPAEAQAMRRVVLAAVAHNTPGRAPAVWLRRRVLVAMTIVAIISVGVAAGLRLDFASRLQQAPPSAFVSPASIAPETADINPQNRQLQFKTAGGTRIIWVFNSELQLKATVR